MHLPIPEHSITEFIRWADYLGTFAFAISGTRLAAAHRFDWFGAYVVGLVTAVGGGTIRDIMLDLPIFWMTEPSYMLITTLALFVTIVFRRWLVRINNTVFLFDAIGLGLFTAVGVAKSLHAGLPWWIAPVMGTVTGAFGGMLRDILINEVPLIFRSDFYAMACVAGSLVYIGILYFGGSVPLAQAFTAITVIVLRLLASKYHWNIPALKPNLDDKE